MKTYSRRRPAPTEIENVLQKCRLCLETSEESIPIFTGESTEVCPLALRVMICTGLEVTNEDSIPNAICTACHREVERYYAFRKKCESSYLKLKSHLQALREKTAVQHENNNCKDKKKCEPITDLNLEPCASVDTDESSMFTMIDLETDSNKDVHVNKLDERNGQLIMQIIENEDVTHYCENNDNLILQIAEEALEEIPESCETNNVQEERIIEIQPEPTLQSNNSMSGYLTSILAQLGIFSEVGGCVVMNHAIRTVELETRDGVVTLEVAEEEENQPVKAPTSKPNIIKKRRNAPAVKTDGRPVKKTRVKKGNAKNVVHRCDACHKTFSSAGVLRRHERAHAGARPHACRTCGRGFTQKEVRDRHELVHREERPFKCTSCDKSFTQRAALAAHARVHAARAPLRLHACAYCPKIFLHQSGLSRHVTSHKGVQHACARCSRAFADKSSLQRHMKSLSHHAETVVGP